MKKRNVKQVKIIVPDEVAWRKVNTIPALKDVRKYRKSLKIGENVENVSHFQYNQITKMFPLVGCKVEEVKII